MNFNTMLDDVTYPVAFLYGVLSFFSYCVLPLIPSYFCFITGMSLDELTTASNAAIRRKIIISTSAFVAGFSLVFIAMGASISLIGGFLSDYKELIRIIGGIFIIVFGLHLSGLLRFPWLDHEKRLNLERKPLHFLGTFIVGMAFGAGWTPCIGPILGAVLGLALDKGTAGRGALLLTFYSAGMALPFMLLSVFINFLLVFIRRTSRILRYINPAAGVVLVIIGGLLVTNKLSLLSFY